MRAVVMDELGPPEVLAVRTVPDPRPRPGEVLVDVELASVTFVETQVRAGRAPSPAMYPPLPAIPGNGVGGRVAGDRRRVVTTTGGTGGYAERVAVPEADLIAVPEAVAMDDAVALLADGRTALGLVEAAGLRAGETALVTAAAGGVGSLLVQLAGAAGARVVAAAGSAEKLGVAAGLGAAAGVDYTQPGWPDAAGPVDVVFDGAGGAAGAEAFALLRRGGRHVQYGMASGAFARLPEAEATARGVRVVRPGRPSPEQLRERSAAALALAAAGRLRPLIGQRLPLERAADAHRAIEARATIGKTLLVVAQS